MYHPGADLDSIPASYVILPREDRYVAYGCQFGLRDFSDSDASTVIQKALDEGGMTFLKAGGYDIKTTLKVRNGAALCGAGRATVLRLADNVGWDGGMIENADFTKGNDHIVIKDLCLDGNKANNAATVNHGIWLDKAKKVLIGNLYIRDFRGAGILTYWDTVKGTVEDIMIRGCLIEDTGNEGISLDELTTRAVVEGNIIVNCRPAIILSDTTYSVISGNIFAKSPSAAPGMYILSDAVRNVITGNVCYENTHSGIYVREVENILTGNLCYGNTRYGIEEVSPADYNLIDSNVCRGNALGGILTVGTNTVVGNNRT